MVSLAAELRQMSQSLKRLRAVVSLPKYSPPIPRPRAAAGDGWRDRVESDPSRSRRALQKGDRTSADSLRWNLDLVLDQRGADMADVPGGAGGCWHAATRARKPIGW